MAKPDINWPRNLPRLHRVRETSSPPPPLHHPRLHCIFLAFLSAPLSSLSHPSNLPFWYGASSLIVILFSIVLPTSPSMSKRRFGLIGLGWGGLPGQVVSSLSSQNFWLVGLGIMDTSNGLPFPFRCQYLLGTSRICVAYLYYLFFPKF